MAAPAETPNAEPRRTRLRSETLDFDVEEVEERIRDFWTRDTEYRAEDIELRLQRYAKLRQWTEGKDDPWPGASDVAHPDITTDYLRTVDTLHNAVMTNRPIVVSRALEKTDVDKQDTIDRHHDYQLFVEQPGEKVIEEACEAFVGDGNVVAFIPWIRERQPVSTVRIFDRIPFDTDPRAYFLELLEQQFPKSDIYPDEEREDGWDWVVTIEPDETRDEDDDLEVSFYTQKKSERVEMVVTSESLVYDGPRVIVKEYEEVVTPPRCANLQRPSPSNPKGAPHVILVDNDVSMAELRKLQQDGFYDLITKDDLDEMESMARDTEEEKTEEQRDVLAGKHPNPREPRPKEQKGLTRLIVFDVFGDAGEDMMWWYILEARKLVKAKRLNEMYPADPPRRPFAEGSFIPILGRREGISLPELMEGLHDFKKAIFDQSVDIGTISTLPIGFYRPTSSIRQEILRLAPGDMVPVPDPSRDIAFPNVGNPGALSYHTNLLAIANQDQDRLTAIGDLQLGRVPQGQASALRTVGGVQTILSQGEARPERILRRFFMFLREVHIQMHQLNRAFLQKDKLFRVQGFVSPDDDPYATISENDLRGKYQFDFTANVQNASKLIQQDSLERLMEKYVNPLTVQLGILRAAGYYRLLVDWGKAVGQDPSDYIDPPSEGAMDPPVLAEEAISAIMRGQMPRGRPLENPEEHLAKLQAFVESEHFGELAPASIELFAQYRGTVARLAAAERQQARLASAAESVGLRSPPDGRLGETPQGPSRQPPVQEGELLDETLPTAGGGGQA